MRPVRELVPPRVQPVARSLYLRVGQGTPAIRMSPSFLLIGGQRCGTTSLFKALAQHPQILRPPVEKGTDYFSLHSHRSMDWYRGHFPLALPSALRPGKSAKAIAFEACTYYMFHPYALERIHRALPDVKLIAMLRDPVERAYSAYKHEFARGFETEPDFERALDLEDTRLEGEEEHMRIDAAYESFSHRHHAYRTRGQFSDQLNRALSLFDHSHLHVIESEQFFEQPVLEFKRVLEFLELDHFIPDRFDQHNARPSSAMTESARTRLEAHYAPYDAQLNKILGHPAHWM